MKVNISKEWLMDKAHLEEGQSVQAGSSPSRNCSETERELLDALKWAVEKNQGPRGDGWVRPMDVGGRDASHHSTTLARLVKRGLVEKRRRCVSIQGVLGSNRAGYEYRLLPNVLRSAAAVADGQMKPHRDRRPMQRMVRMRAQGVSARKTHLRKRQMRLRSCPLSQESQDA